jgi:lactate permease
MQLLLYSLLALVPIITAFVLLVIANRPATQAMPIAYLVTVILALGVWQVPFWQVVASTLEGLLTTLEILYIVFGAILLLNTLQTSGAISKIRQGLLGISSDRRIQVIIIAMLFGSFIEGASGFGTPAVICVPLLVAIGFPPMAAVIASLITQAAPSTFGAVGTPMIIGITGGLSDSAIVENEINRLGLNFSEYLGQISIKTALIQGIISIFIPLLLVSILTGLFGENRSWREGLSITPFALFAGISFAIPYALTAYLIGPEFPTILGGLVGLAIVVPATKNRWFAPVTNWDFPPPAEWSEIWQGSIKSIKMAVPEISAKMPGFKAWMPYILLGILLALSRFHFLPFRQWLQSFQINFPNILGTEISASTQPLFLPATIFIMVVVITYFLHGLQPKQLQIAIINSFQKLLGTALAIGASVPMAKVFINSGVNESGLASMPLTLADGVSSLTGQTWPFFAPIIGAVGSFVAGSTTVSNMMFSLFQFGVAQQIDVSPPLILALQSVGAAAGNMIAIPNIVAAAATVSLIGCEGILLSQLFLPLSLYLLLAGILGVIATLIF